MGNGEFIDNRGKGLQQLVHVLAPADRDADATFATFVRRAITDQNAAVPHLLRKKRSIRSRMPHTHEHKIALARPELDPTFFQRVFQPLATFEYFGHILYDVGLIRECFG